jgi:cell division protein FtsL
MEKEMNEKLKGITPVIFMVLGIAIIILAVMWSKSSTRESELKEQLSDAREIIRETRRINDELETRIKQSIERTGIVETKLRTSLDRIRFIEAGANNIAGIIRAIEVANNEIRTETERVRTICK